MQTLWLIIMILLFAFAGVIYLTLIGLLGAAIKLVRGGRPVIGLSLATLVVIPTTAFLLRPEIDDFKRANRQREVSSIQTFGPTHGPPYNLYLVAGKKWETHDHELFSLVETGLFEVYVRRTGWQPPSMAGFHDRVVLSQTPECVAIRKRTPRYTPHVREPRCASFEAQQGEIPAQRLNLWLGYAPFAKGHPAEHNSLQISEPDPVTGAERILAVWHSQGPMRRWFLHDRVMGLGTYRDDPKPDVFDFVLRGVRISPGSILGSTMEAP